jgi:hypothetical protein
MGCIFETPLFWTVLDSLELYLEAFLDWSLDLWLADTFLAILVLESALSQFSLYRRFKREFTGSILSLTPSKLEFLKLLRLLTWSRTIFLFLNSEGLFSLLGDTSYSSSDSYIFRWPVSIVKCSFLIFLASIVDMIEPSWNVVRESLLLTASETDLLSRLII